MKSKAAFQLFPNMAESLCSLGDKNLVLLMREITYLIAQIDIENITELEQKCDDFESKLGQKGKVFAQFLLLKPHIIKYWQNVINGNKGRDFGTLGGAPIGNQNARKKQPPIKDNIKDINDKDIKDKAESLFNDLG